jgi:hypothetical protein
LNTLKLLGLLGPMALLSSCGTPEFQAAQSSCTSTWLTQIPPRYEQEMYNQTQTRQVPTGQTTCTGYGYTVTCNQVMRTEYYTIPAIRTVDRNLPLRNVRIQACTQNICMQQYGNTECKAA